MVRAFSAVEKLFRLLEFGGLRDDVPIFSCNESDSLNQKVIGHTRIWMTYDVGNEEQNSSSNSVDGNERNDLTGEESLFNKKQNFNT